MTTSEGGGQPEIDLASSSIQIDELNSYAVFAPRPRFYDCRGQLAERLTGLVGDSPQIDVQDAEIEVFDTKSVSVESDNLLLQTPVDGGVDAERAFIAEAAVVVAETLSIPVYQFLGVGINAIIPGPGGLDLSEFLNDRFGLARPVLDDLFTEPLQPIKHLLRVTHEGLVYRIELEALANEEVEDHGLLGGDPSDYPDEFLFVNVKALNPIAGADFREQAASSAGIFDKVLSTAIGLDEKLRLELER